MKRQKDPNPFNKIIFSVLFCASLTLAGCNVFKPPQFQTYHTLFQSAEYRHSSVGIVFINDTLLTRENKKALYDLTDKVKYSPDKTAVFDCDGTLIDGDITEGAMKGNRKIPGMLPWLINNRKLVNADYTRDIYRIYEEACKNDKKTCYRMPAEILRGLRQSDVMEWARQLWEREYQDLIFPESKAVIRHLAEKGFDIYIISASPVEFVKPISRYIGVPESNIYGITQSVKNGILTGSIVEPMPYGEGKVAVMRDVFHINPLFCMGDSLDNDSPMLRSTVRNGGLAFFINPKNDITAKKAEGYDFKIQYNSGWEIIAGKRLGKFLDALLLD